LLLSLGPHFEQIEAQLEASTALREKPAGTIRPEHVRIELLVECDAVEALPTSVGCACSHCYQ
jgi:hypothetical protein